MSGERDISEDGVASGYGSEPVGGGVATTNNAAVATSLAETDDAVTATSEIQQQHGSAADSLPPVKPSNASLLLDKANVPVSVLEEKLPWAGWNAQADRSPAERLNLAKAIMHCYAYIKCQPPGRLPMHAYTARCCYCRLPNRACSRCALLLLPTVRASSQCALLPLRAALACTTR